MKRVLSLLLALVMVFGLLPATASANQLDNGLLYWVNTDHVVITDYVGDSTEVVIPAEIEGLPVTSIGNNAFLNCSSLTSIVIPDSVTSIGNNAFFDCSSLTSIVIPDSVNSIGEFAFYNCSSLTNIVIPDSVTAIRNETFSDCSSLTNIVIPDSITSIGEYAFSWCSSLTIVCFEGNAPEFANSVFNWITATVYYPVGNPTWTKEVMQDYDGDITWVAYDPSHVHEYTIVVTDPTCTERGFTTYTCSCGYSYTDYVDAFGHDFINGICSRCSTLELSYEVYEDHVEITGYNGESTEVVIPAEIEGLPVTSIRYLAFANCSSLTSIIIPDSVTHIGYWAFSDCHGLTNIHIPNSVTYIGEYAFHNCTNLLSIFIPESVTYIGEFAFSFCNSLTGIHVDKNNPNYSSDERGVLFDKEKTMLIQAPAVIAGSYVVPNSVITICNDAFSGCYNLTSTSIPDSVTSIGNNAFDSCENLTTADLGNNIISIGDSAFSSCYSLTNVSFPNSITSIGSSAFSSCSSLTSVYIPASVTTIGMSAFSNCESLTGIHVDANNPNYSSDTHGFLFDKAKTALIKVPIPFKGSYTIPNSVTRIEEWAFAHCYFLTSISIPDSVITIGNCAFFDCDSLTDIDLGDSITYIGEEAFTSCDELISVSIPASMIIIDRYAFSNCQGLTTIYFEGDAPYLGDEVFNDITATAYYPAGNPTWTEDVMQDYDGYITWVAYDPNTPVNPFTDVPAGCWYEAPVMWALENGVTSGSSETTFSPADKCLRAHVVTFLWNAEECPAPAAAASTFTDVPAGAWYEKPVLWAVENGITSGTSATKFGAGDVCSRYQVVFFLWKAAGSPEPETTVNPFTDVNPGHFFYKAVLWAVENEITSGTSATTFGPTAPCNRAQVVTFLYAAYN